jgi:NAD(P)-dependent dehydrogenase (short-subunit alcohol dehydrogenase family)
MKDKIILITGSTSGIGKAAAFSLAKSGASLILLGRSEKKGNELCKQIARMTGNAELKFFKADLMLLREVKLAAEKIFGSFTRIDVLINNAGARFLGLKVSPEGIEQTLAVNYLSHFLLTDILLDRLKSAPSARIINVASSSHYTGKGIIRNVLLPSDYNGKQQYSDSKLANVLFTYKLAEKLEETKITVNAMDPGGVATNFARNNGLKYWMKHRIYYLLKRELLTAQQGADTIIFLASSEEVEGVTGKYFYKRKIKSSSELSYNKEMQNELWDMSKKMIMKAVEYKAG